MKRVALVILVLSLWSIETKAQMQQGSWMLEGSAGFNRSRSYFPDTDEKSNPVSGYTLHPKAGFFVTDNLALGLSGLFANTWGRNQSYDPDIPGDYKKGNILNYGGGVFLRKYAPINESLSFFAEVGSEVSWIKEISFHNEPLGKMENSVRRVISAQAILGLQYLISPKLGVHLQTNLLQYQNSQELPAEFSEFRAGFLIDPRFGLTIFL